MEVWLREEHGKKKVREPGFLVRCVIILALGFVVSVASPTFCMSEERCPSNTGEETQTEHPAEEIPEKSSTTTHKVTIDGKEHTYTAVAGEIVIEIKERDAKARVFYVSYTLEGNEGADRPISFAFNGGPGAASVWLHLGCLGPMTVRLNDNGTVLPPPVEYGENPDTWLAFTDLVFVDPVGTGFSRGEPDKQETSTKFYGVMEDIESVAEFIRVYLGRENRWISPTFLVGESYGTTRVSSLAWYLHQRYGVETNGIVLISPVLDYDTILFHPSNDLPHVLFLPSYAAAAWHHHLLQEEMKDKELDPFLDEVEQFCLTEYMVLLAQGENLSFEDRQRLEDRLAAYTGLPKPLILRANFRVDWMTFTKNLLRDEHQLVGRMDSSITGIDPDPTSHMPAYDPSLDPLFGPFSSAMNAYVRNELGYESDLFYEFLNQRVTRSWDWRSGLMMGQGYIDVSHRLRDAMAINKDLAVFVASGLYDLATPYFAATYTVSHMWLGPQRSNVAHKIYRSGHMIYTQTEARKKLFEDTQIFYERTLHR